MKFHPQVEPKGWFERKNGTTTFVLRLPYPLANEMQALTPHAEGRSWRKKHDANKAQKNTARFIASEHAPAAPWEHATVSFLFVKPDNRRLDRLNMVQRFKGAIDGVVKAGFLKDDDERYLSVGSVETSVSRTKPRVELRFTRSEVSS